MRTVHMLCFLYNLADDRRISVRHPRGADGLTSMDVDIPATDSLSHASLTWLLAPERAAASMHMLFRPQLTWAVLIPRQ